MSTESSKILTKEDFDKHLNTEFKLQPEQHEPIKMELIETCDKSNKDINGFSLTFLGKSETIFPQRIYKILHKEMGEINMFIVPFKKDEKGIYYDAIFSRLKTNE